MINKGSDKLKLNLFVTIFFTPSILFQRQHDKYRLRSVAGPYEKYLFSKLTQTKNLRLASRPSGKWTVVGGYGEESHSEAHHIWHH